MQNAEYPIGFLGFLIRMEEDEVVKKLLLPGLLLLLSVSPINQDSVLCYGEKNVELLKLSVTVRSKHDGIEELLIICD